MSVILCTVYLSLLLLAKRISLLCHPNPTYQWCSITPNSRASVSTSYTPHLPDNILSWIVTSGTLVWTLWPEGSCVTDCLNLSLVVGRFIIYVQYCCFLIICIMGDLMTDGLGVDCSYSERIWYNKSIDIVHYFKNRQLRLPQNITTKKIDD